MTEVTFVVVSRNRPQSLARCIRSIRSRVGLSHRIAIIDDSTRINCVRQNAKLAQDTEAKYVNSVNWRSIRAEYCPELASFGPLCNLNQRGWNSGCARNVAQAVMLLSPTQDAVIWLDDDMELHWFEENDAVEAGQGSLLVARFEGSPDISRLEWLMLVLQLCGGRQTGAYLRELAQSASASALWSLVARYTTIVPHKALVEQRHESARMSIKWPPRPGLSGGAFACSVRNLADAMFPNWFNEDVVWGSSILPIGSDLNVLRSRVLNEPAPKDPCSLPDLIAEERGRVLSTVLVWYRQGHPQKDLVSLTRSVIEERLIDVIALQRILEKQQLRLASCIGEEKANQIKAVLAAVFQFLVLLKPQCIARVVADFLVWETRWRGIFSDARLSQIDDHCIATRR